MSKLNKTAQWLQQATRRKVGAIFPTASQYNRMNKTERAEVTRAVAAMKHYESYTAKHFTRPTPAQGKAIHDMLDLTSSSRAVSATRAANAGAILDNIETFMEATINNNYRLTTGLRTSRDKDGRIRTTQIELSPDETRKVLYGSLFNSVGLKKQKTDSQSFAMALSRWEVYMSDDNKYVVFTDAMIEQRPTQNRRPRKTSNGLLSVQSVGQAYAWALNEFGDIDHPAVVQVRDLLNISRD